MYRAYCLHCKREREVDDARIHHGRDDTTRISGKCHECHHKVSAFVKSHTGGRLRTTKHHHRRRGSR